jgi:hypothetical protein
MGIPKLLRLKLPRLCGAIILCADLWSKWDLKQSCSPLWDLSINVSHATFTWGNRVDSRLLVVENQTANLTLDLSFQWYKELFNAMGFDTYNRSLKILGIHRDSNSQNGNSLRSVSVHSHTRPHFRLLSWPTPLQAFAFVASPRLGLRHFMFYLCIVCTCCFKNLLLKNPHLN